MAHGIFQGDDIEIYLTQMEANCLGQFEIKDNKVRHIPLEVNLKIEGGNTLKAIIQKQDFDNLGDGIEVERKDYGFFVRINQKAHWRIVDNPLSGTRYDGSNKINFRRE